jgi:hypothetical protein
MQAEEIRTISRWRREIHATTGRCGERGPADSLREEPNTISGWLSSLTFALDGENMRTTMSIIAVLTLSFCSVAIGQTNSSGADREAAVRSRIAARAASESVTNAHSFGIFMPREDVLNFTRDVEERIRVYLKSKPEDIPLAKYPLISDQDIESYDWKTHTLTMDRSAIRRILRPLVWGTPFVVVVDGAPVYIGAFYSGASSQSCPVPVILTDGFLNRTNTLVIDRAYPGATPDQLANDPRSDARIKNSLQALGKLKE